MTLKIFQKDIGPRGRIIARIEAAGFRNIGAEVGWIYTKGGYYNEKERAQKKNKEKLKTDNEPKKKKKAKGKQKKAKTLRPPSIANYMFFNEHGTKSSKQGIEHIPPRPVMSTTAKESEPLIADKMQELEGDLQLGYITDVGIMHVIGKKFQGLSLIHI